MKKTLLAIVAAVTFSSSPAFAQLPGQPVDWAARRAVADSFARATAEATAVVYGGFNSPYPPVVQQAMVSRNTINAWYDTMNSNPNLPYNGAYGAYIGPSPARCAPMYIAQPVVVPVVVGGGCGGWGGGGWGPGGAIGFGAGAAAIGYGAQNYNYSNTNWGIGINAGVGGNSGSFGGGGFGNTSWGIGINTGIGGNSGSFRSW